MRLRLAPLAFLALAACGGDSLTEVIVFVDADDVVAARASALRVTVLGGSTFGALAPSRDPFIADVSAGWPRLFALVPANGDTTRVFDFHAEALDASGSAFVSARLRSGYITGEVRTFTLRLEEACIGMACGATDTCRAAVCVGAFVEPSMSMRYDAGTGDGDGGGATDAGESDASTLDGGRDSGPPTDGCVGAGAPDPAGDDVDTNCDGIDGDELIGVFVAPAGEGGDDANPGTRARPVASLERGLALVELLARDPSELYVAAGTYSGGEIAITNGVGIYGGYDAAADWARRDGRSTIEGAQTVFTVTAPERVTLDGLYVRAGPAVALSTSSVAVRVDGVTADLVIADCEIAAGDGRAGVPGMAGASGASGGSGGNGAGTGGGGAGMAPCAAGRGGRGGNGDTDMDGGTGGDPGEPGEAVGLAAGGSAGANGDPGAHGRGGVAGGTLGFVDGNGLLVVLAGESGTNGGFGAGGGGGNGGNTFVSGVGQQGGGGGGGGSGGCPGIGGGAGTGGGASIALLASNGATLSVERTTLRTGAGGTGGNGGNGGAGGPSGMAGAGAGGIGGAGGANGGQGGPGGDGGGGSGGAGGPVFGILSTKDSEVRENGGVIIALGVAGIGGPGGIGANTSGMGQEGSTGMSANTVVLP